MLMYVQDYDERFTVERNLFYTSGGRRWFQAIAPYVKNSQVFACPSAPTLMTETPANSGYYFGGYGYNGYGTNASNGLGYRYESDSGAPAAGGYSLSDIEDPSRMMMLSEPVSNNGILRGYGTSYIPGDRHNGGSNVAHVDGHAKWYTKETLNPNKTSTWSDRTHPAWPYWVRKPSTTTGY
jgi:prepilin-type processing-associated H-X9-DG protein